MNTLTLPSPQLCGSSTSVYNLYRIDFEHFSDHSSADGIKEFLIAENDIDVINHIDSKYQFNDWNDKIKEGESGYDEDYNEMPYLDYLLSNKGNMGADDCDDCTYGVNHYGWEVVETNIDAATLNTLVKLGVATVLRK